MTKYYTPMKRKEFCKEVSYFINYLYKKLYVLPNGRVFKYSSTELVDVISAQVNECKNYFDIRDNTYVETHTDESTYYILKRHDYNHYEYFYNTRYYIISPHSMKIKYISGNRDRYDLEGQRCGLCNAFHSFMLSNPHNNTLWFETSILLYIKII